MATREYRRYAHRRCALQVDGGCGKVQPWREYYRGDHCAPYRLCARCRTGVSMIERAEALYLDGAPWAEVMVPLQVHDYDRAYSVAKNQGWSFAARKAALMRRAMEESPNCMRKGCMRPHLPDSPRCEYHERQYEKTTSYYVPVRRAKPVRRYAPSRVARVKHHIRCEQCGRHRWTALSESCECGYSGATPVSAWDVAMGDVGDVGDMMEEAA